MTVETPRHLADPERGVILRNGASVRVRAIRPDDERRLLALCGRLSPRTLYQRFFSFRRLLPEEARAFANVDYGLRMAVVAEVDDGAGARAGRRGAIRPFRRRDSRHWARRGGRLARTWSGFAPSRGDPSCGRAARHP